MAKKTLTQCFYSVNDKFGEYLKEQLGDNMTLVTTFISIANNDKVFRGLFEGSMDKLSPSMLYESIKTYYYNKRGDASLTVNKNYSGNVNLGAFATSSERQDAILRVVGLYQTVYADYVKDLGSNGKQVSKTKTKSDYTTDVKAHILKIAGARAESIIEKLSEKDESEFTENDLAIIEAIDDEDLFSKYAKILRLSSNATDNYWGNMCAEMISEDADKFLEEVTYNPSLQFFNGELSKEDVTSNQITNDAAQALYTDGENAEWSDDIDRYAKMLFGDADSGLFINAMKHVDSFVRAYLGSLEKLKTYQKQNGKFIVDRDNIAGIPDHMSPEECIDIIYHNTDISSADRFVNDLDKIAMKYKGFEAFAKLADDLRNNDQLRYYFYTVFGKQIVRKRIIDLNEDGIFISKLSNPKSDKTNALKYEFVNTIKQTCLNSINDDIYPTLNNISKLCTSNGLLGQLLDAIKLDKAARAKVSDNSSKAKLLDNRIEQNLSKLNENLNTTVVALTECLHTYLPTINADAVKSMITYDGQDKIITKILALCNMTKALHESAIQSQYDYYGLKMLHGKLWSKYKQLTKYDENENRVGTPEEISNAEKAYKASLRQTYVSPNLQKSAEDLAFAFSNFIVGSCELNSPNAHGNLSSDVINSSYLTYLNHLVNQNIGTTVNERGDLVFDNSRLENFARYRFGGDKVKNHQYDFSNIMFEHGSGNNKIKGFFKKHADGTVTVTDEAHKLLGISLFNGVSNSETGDGATYSEIVHNDFKAAAFIQFFQPGKDVDPGLASYFVRTQSDAPKTYILTMPKYDVGTIGSTTGLLSVKDYDFLLQENERINAETIHSVVNENQTTDNSIKVDVNRAMNFLVQSSPYPVFLNTKNKSTAEKYFVNYTEDDGKKTKLLKVTYTDEHNQFFVMYLSGNLAQRGNNLYYLDNPKLHHVENYNQMPESLKDAILFHREQQFAKAGALSFNVNTNHVLFDCYRNTLMQEITDAGQQFLNLFQIDLEKTKANVKMIDGKQVFFAVFENENDVPMLKKEYGDNESATYDKYHRNGSRYKKITGKRGNKILARDANGKLHLTGNIFHSDRFTIFKKGTKNEKARNRNYGDELFIGKGEEAAAIDILYGGAERGLQIAVTFDENGNVQFEQVVLNENQRKAVDEKLQEFISDVVVSGVNRIGATEKLLPYSYKTFENVANFVLNYRNMYNSMNDLIEGDSKFYNDGQDFLKRAKEGQAGGIPMGIANFDLDLSKPSEEITSVLGVANDESTQEYIATYTRPDGSVGKKPIMLRTKFNAITVNNTVGITKDALAMKKHLVEKGLMDEAKAEKYISNFDYTKTNDAQSYITFPEFVRRITMMGEFNQYKDLIEKILSGEELNNSDIDEFIQVQKNFFYDQMYDNEFNVVASRQIKNAEFVLIPQLLTYKDENGNEQKTDLGKLYDWMMENDIDQLNTAETSKAGKKAILTLWDNNGHIPSWDAFNDSYKANPNAKQDFSYNFLYRQQKTPQHVDANNKAGIQIVKKIIDNIPDSGHPLSELKKQFMDLYSANIKGSFDSFSRALNIAIDSKGNLKTDDNGYISVNVEALYSKLKEEAKRLGLNSNEIDYMTLENGVPKVPSHFTIFSLKLENIVNSMINRAITRQTLPGFHAAQVTGLGISERWKRSEGNIKSASEAGIDGNKLRYHPNGEAYIEVVIPRFSIFDNMTDEEIFTKIDKNGVKEGEEGYDASSGKNYLERNNIDKFIGYRIPTEGKQSVAVMKIVGFCSKAQGSTIIVPDDWVAQTGADFDIDSIYAINYKLHKDLYGNIVKYDYKDGTSIHDIINRYESYLKINGKEFEQETEELSQDSKDLKNDRRNKIKKFKELQEENNNAFEAVMEKESKTYFTKLTADEREEVDKILKPRNDYRNKIATIIQTYSNSTSENLREFAKVYEEIAKTIDKISKDGSSFGKSVRNLNDAILKNLNEQAKLIGCVDFDTFKNMSIEEQNTKDARDSKILDTLLAIASSDTILQETLAQSNFRDIAGEEYSARENMMNEDDTVQRAGRSPYDFFDQADFQEDAMSGAMLKAFSVSRDTFCSICNKVRPTLAKGFKAIYEVSDGYDYKTLADRFGATSVKELQRINVDGTRETVIEVLHNKLGWSQDNKNIDNEYITVYTSQTTAYHLDAVKTGGIPNLNTYTFGVYKTLVDMGSNYKVAVGFIMQPGIARIIDAYSDSQSIFERDYNRLYVDSAIKKLAMDMGMKCKDKPVDIYTNIDDLIDEFNKKEYLDKFKRNILSQLGMENEFVERFTFLLNGPQIANLAISPKLLEQRQKADNYDKNGKPLGGIFSPSNEDYIINRNLFDLMVMLQFHSMNEIVNNIENYSAVCSPDKFGAKQTMFGTQKVFNDISRLLDNGKDKFGFITVQDKTGKRIDMLESIYPGINHKDSNGDIDLQQFISSTGESSYPSLNNFLKYSSALSILLGRKIFNTQKKNYINNIYRIADELGVEMTEKLFNDFRDYVTAYGMTVNISESVKGIEFNDEVARNILGAGKNIITEFYTENISNPLPEEREAFSKLTPAQKVSFIQSNFTNGLIFDYLTTNVYPNGNKDVLKPQVINFNHDSINIEVAFDLFRKAYYNDNFFIHDAVLSLIDYAIVAEKFKLKRNGISKIITNDVLADSGYMNVFNISDSKILDKTFTDDLYTTYIRGHYDNVKRFKINSNSELVQGGHINRYKGVLEPIYLGEIDAGENSLGYRMGIIDSHGKYPNYLRMIIDKNDILMKAMITKDGALFYYPLNKLESYEMTRYSLNQINNKYFPEEAYQAYIEYYGDQTAAAKIFTDELRYERIKQEDVDIFNPESLNQSMKIEWDNILKKINDHFKTGLEEPLFIRSGRLSDKVKNIAGVTLTSTEYGDVSKADGRNYTILKVKYDNYSKVNNGATKFVKNKSISWYLKHYEKEGVLDGLNHSFKQILIDLKNSGNEEMGGKEILCIIPYTVKHSTAPDFVDMMQAMEYDAREGSKSAYNGISGLRGVDITVDSLESINKNPRRVTDVLQKHISYKTKKLLNKVDEYLEKPNSDEYYSIDDKAVMDRIIADKAYRDEFLKFVLDYDKFLNRYNAITTFDVSQYDADTAFNIQQAQKSIQSLYNNHKLNNARKAFLVDYVKSITTDPLLLDNIFQVTDGYNNVSGLEGWISSSLEAGVPLMQIVIKDVLGDIKGQEMYGKIYAEEFDKNIREIAKSGTFNWQNIIDDEGFFYRDYNDQLKGVLEDKLKYLANLGETKGYNSVEYMKASNEYRRWKNKNFHQRYVKSYYDEVNNNEKQLLDTYPEIYSEYRNLNDQINELRRATYYGEATEKEEELLNELQDKLNLLRGNLYIDGEKIRKRKLGEKGTTRVNCAEAAEALDKYIKTSEEINKKYFQGADMEGFNIKLNEMLRTLAKYEHRDAEGRYEFTPEELMSKPEYAKAYKWVHFNAELVLTDDALKKEIMEAYKSLKKNQTLSASSQFREMAKRAGAYDIYGVCDGRKFTDAQRSSIKFSQVKRMSNSIGRLIKPVLNNGIIFKEDFYSPMLKGSKFENVDYKEITSKINAILNFACNRQTGSVNMSNLSIDQLNELAALYDKLNSRNIKRYTRPNKTSGRNISEYISENAEFKTDYDVFAFQEAEARRKNDEIPGYLEAWRNANMLYVEDEDGNAELMPNRFLYTYMKPKGKLNVEFDENGKISKISGDKAVVDLVDETKTNAVSTIRKNTRDVPTMYYYKAMREAQQRDLTEPGYLHKWMQDNHIYNTYTGEITPIECWTRTEYINANKESANNEGYTWVNKRDRISKVIKGEYENKKYVKGRGMMLANYDKVFGDYNNNNVPTLSNQEQAIKLKLQEMLATYLPQGDKALNEGRVPVKADINKDATWWAKQFGATIGWYDGSELKEFTEHLYYDDDSPAEMPMMQQLKSKGSRRVPHLMTFDQYGKSKEEYEEYKKKTEQDIKTIEEDNLKIHKSILSKDWNNVFKEFIVRASREKAIQDNKYMMYFALNTLRDMESYLKPSDIKDRKYSVDYKHSTKERVNYMSENMDDAVELMETFMRRIMLHQKKRNNGYLTRLGNVLQNSSSAKYMMSNITGGIVNVTYGETQIWQEAIAKQFFTSKGWIKGNAIYDTSLPNFIYDYFNDKSSSKATAVAKIFNIVEPDQVVELADMNVDELIKKFRNAAYIMQSGGEHYMQNRVLFAMMSDYKVVPTINEEGVTNVKILNAEEYLRLAETEALESILEKYPIEKANYASFKDVIRSDKNNAKDFVHRRKFIATNFIENLKGENRKQIQKDYAEALVKFKKEYKKKFDSLKDVYSQFDLSEDGQPIFHADSYFASMKNKRKAWSIIGEFANTVFSVNQKIHGVYDQLGAAKLEQEWYGSVVMQFHKHIYPGIMKRYRREGYYNEIRHSTEKGSFWSLIDFLNVNLDTLKNQTGLSDSDLIWYKGIQNTFRYLSSYLQAISLRWNILPESEKSNILRNASDWIFLTIAFGTSVAAKALWDEDDKDEGLVYNGLMNAIDRTEMELMLYGAGYPPFWGPINETKTLWKNPAACGSTIEDLFNIMSLCSDYIMTGGEADMEYHNGVHRGENKLKVWTLRQIPIYRGIDHFRSLPKNNHAYKLQSNQLQNYALVVANSLSGRDSDK